MLFVRPSLGETGPDGKRVESFTIITTEPNEKDLTLSLSSTTKTFLADMSTPHLNFGRDKKGIVGTQQGSWRYLFFLRTKGECKNCQYGVKVRVVTKMRASLYQIMDPHFFHLLSRWNIATSALFS